MKDKALEHFKKQDGRFYDSVADYADHIDELEAIDQDMRLYRLLRSIASQQLSVKAASTIWGRVEVLVGADPHMYDPHVFDSISDEDLRAAGLSYQKIGYLRSISESIGTGEVSLDSLDDLGDSEVVEELTKLKGVGVWTAEMFLMSALARPDVFSVGDLGLVTAAERIWGVPRTDKEAIRGKLEPLSPYRTYASLLMWTSLDNTPN